MKKLLPIIFITVIVIGGGAFWGGMKYAQVKSSTNGRGSGSFANGQRPGRMGGQGMRGGFTNGEILSKDDKSITVKLTDGGSRIIFFSASTTIGKIAPGTLSDLEVGKQVLVTGSGNSDGSMTAQNIQLRPIDKSGKI